MIKVSRGRGGSWRVPTIVIVVLVLASIGATFVVRWILADEEPAEHAVPHQESALDSPRLV
jgi:hypothetical protein